ncbi:MAG: copper amine oxidase N-terminal domain-containing protein [Clostridia bacterium]|nr:copper amine oxidase N-terminal domain-containing protein [Clostridia bacterium]
MKKIRITVTALAMIGVLALGAGAATVQQQITATLRPDISVTVDGKKQALTSQDGGAVSPVLYNGTTYLPVRALSEALGKDVTWDQKTQTVILTTPEQPDASTGATPSQTKPTASDSSASNTSYEKSITALSSRVDALEKGTWNWNTYRQIDRDADALDDELELAYKNGKLTYEQYKSLERSLDSVDDRLDRLEDLREKDD